MIERTRSGAHVLSEGVVVEAPAKVNLHLGVGSLRSDGYHDVETVLQTVDLIDYVSVRPADTLRLRCETDLGISAEQNLVWRAVERLARRLGREPLVEIELSKIIPAGAGLGGGSSDAAAALAGLAAMWGIDGTTEDASAPVDATLTGGERGGNPLLAEVAASIGADVPFFLGGGTALLGGRGDEFVRRIQAPALELVIMKPQQGVDTAAAYAAFDRAPVVASGSDIVVDACESGDAEAVACALSNNLERASIALVPEVADALAWLRRADGVLGGAVAGSGSAVFGICADRASATGVAAAAQLAGWWSVAVRSRENGVRVRPVEEAS